MKIGLHSTRWTRPLAGFTLIELLTVIAIIMILIGLLMPAAAMLRQSTKRKAAATRAQSVCQAIKNYRQVYGKFPGQFQDSDDQVVAPDVIVAELMDNPRKMLFLEFSPKELDEDGFLVDPWQMPYEISMDENADGVTDLSASYDGTLLVDTNVIGHSVCVMSWGGRPEDEDERVYSWIR